MKGYTQVERSVIKAAVTNWKHRYDNGKVIRDKGIELFYHRKYVLGSRFTKWWHRNDTKQKFALSHLPFMGDWSDILHPYFDEDELDILDDWQWGRGREQYAACKGLLDVGLSTIRLDNDLCRWVNKHK